MRSVLMRSVRMRSVRMSSARRRRRIGAAGLVFGLLATLVVAAPAQADTIRNREYWLADYGISAAWKTTKGKGVTIAIIDTGVDSSHPDLAGVVTGGTDFSGRGASNGQKPVGGTGSEHATMVAALAAGRGHGAGAGVIGSAPAASVLSISIGFGAGSSDSDEQAAKAIRWAVDNGADVINMSFTRNTLDWPTSWDDAFLYAQQHDVVIVAAAGNRGSGTSVVGAPATIPGVLTVAGLDRAGTASQDASAQGITIGVAAPSEQLVGAVPGGGYVLWNGTSGASPIVAGVVALVRAAHPELDAANVINRILQTAKPAGASGVDPIYGYGKLDAAAAVSKDVPLVSANPMGDLTEWIRLHRRADSTPAPEPTAASLPAPETTPIALGPPRDDTLMPTVTELREIGIPLLIYFAFGLAFLVVLIGAVRHFRGVRRNL
jgi:type VII secretion-associated serine protease mycosin